MTWAFKLTNCRTLPAPFLRFAAIIKYDIGDKRHFRLIPAGILPNLADIIAVPEGGDEFMRATKFWRLFGLSLLISAGGLSAAAAQDYPNPGTAQLNLRLTVAEGCHLNNEDTGTVIEFPPTSNLDNPRWLPGNFSVKCTAGYSGNHTLNVTLNAGKYSGDTIIPSRKLHFDGGDTSSTLDFQVFIDNGGTSNEVWGGDPAGQGEPMKVNLTFDGANLVGSGKYMVELLKQSLEGKYVGAYSNTLQMAISYQ